MIACSDDETEAEPCTTDEQCDEGFTCNVSAGVCEEITGCTTDEQCEGDLICVILDGATTGTCTEPSEVSCDSGDGDPRGLCTGAGEFCINDACRVPFTLVSVASNTTVAADFSASNPGPDVDAIEIIRGGQSVWAMTVEGSRIGTVAGQGENTNCQNPASVVGEPKSMPRNGQDGQCTLSGTSEEDRNRYFCLGGGTTTIGYVTVSFGDDFYLMDGDQIRVWELAPVGTTGSEFGCSNTTTQRNDGYSVFAGTQSTNTDPIGNNAFIELGATGDQGGVFRFTFNDPDAE